MKILIFALASSKLSLYAADVVALWQFMLMEPIFGMSVVRSGAL